MLRYTLYQVLEKNAEKLTGPQVIRALKAISEEMYAAGIDSALRKTEGKIHNWDNIASAWDLTWMTLFTARLAALGNKK